MPWLRLAGSAGPLLLLLYAGQAPPAYDIVIRGGHVIDPRNGIDGVRDVAVAAGRIAAVAPRLDAAATTRVIDAAGLYVTPGLVDIHAHVYAGTGERGSYAGDNSVLYHLARGSWIATDDDRAWSSVRSECLRETRQQLRSQRLPHDATHA